VIVNGRFQDYKNKAYMLLLESRWRRTWRTAVHYINRVRQLQACSIGVHTTGLEGPPDRRGRAITWTPSVYILGSSAS